MSYLSLALALVFVVIPIILSFFLKLGLEKDIVIASIRATIQLIIIGYILQFVFDSESTLFMLLMIALIIRSVSQNMVRVVKIIPYITVFTIGSINDNESISIATFVLFNIILLDVKYVFPILRMINGICIIVSLLFLSRFSSE